MFSFFFFRESGWTSSIRKRQVPKLVNLPFPRLGMMPRWLPSKFLWPIPLGSPKQVPADYYYRVPVRPIYKSYPVYAAGHEPTGYLESLKHKDPIIYWDDKGHAPTLETEADWINAGEAVFDAPIGDGGVGGSEPTDLYVRDPKFLEMTGAPITRDGTLPYFRYVVKKKGEVEIGVLACGMCHTRVMPDGSVLKGAQGNFPFDRYFALDYLRSSAKMARIARTKPVRDPVDHL